MKATFESSETTRLPRPRVQEVAGLSGLLPWGRPWVGPLGSYRVIDTRSDLKIEN